MNTRGLLLFARYPAMLPVLAGVAIVSALIMHYAELRWNRPSKPLPPLRYRRKSRTAAMRSRR